MVDRCMRTDSSLCDPSHITLDLRSLVIWLGPQLEESFLTHLSTIRFSLIIPLRLTGTDKAFYICVALHWNVLFFVFSEAFGTLRSPLRLEDLNLTNDVIPFRLIGKAFHVCVALHWNVLIFVFNEAFGTLRLPLLKTSSGVIAVYTCNNKKRDMIKYHLWHWIPNFIVFFKPSKKSWYRKI